MNNLRWQARTYLVERAEILSAAGRRRYDNTKSSSDSCHFLSTRSVPGRGQARCYLSSSSQCPEEVGLVIISIFQVSKLKLREFKQLYLRSLS